MIMSILIINGSHRKGNTDLITKLVSDALKSRKIDIKELFLRDIEIKLPDGCEICGEGGVCPNVRDQFSEEIEPTIRAYDVYILATPTWSGGITPLAKIFWDRIVSWCADDKKYLKGKKIAVITHGMAEISSWRNVINWVKSVCVWEEAFFAGSFTCKSGSKIGNIKIRKGSVTRFVDKIVGP